MARKICISTLAVLTLFFTSLILFNKTGKNVVIDKKSIQNLQYGKLTNCITVIGYYTSPSCDGNSSIPFLEFLYPWKIKTSDFKEIKGGNTINIREMVNKTLKGEKPKTLDYYYMDPEDDLEDMKQEDLDCGFCYIYTTHKLFMSQINYRRYENLYIRTNGNDKKSNELRELRQHWMDFDRECMNYNLFQLAKCKSGDYINAFNSLIRIGFRLPQEGKNVYEQFAHRFLSKKNFKDYITPFQQPRVKSDGIEDYTPIRFILGQLVDQMNFTNNFSDLNFGEIAIQLCLDTLRKINNTDSSDIYTCIKEADFGYKTERDIYNGCKKPHVAVLVSVKKSSDNYLLQFAHQWRKNQTTQTFGSYFYITVPVIATSGIETENPCRIGLGKSVQVTDEGISNRKPVYINGDIQKDDGSLCPVYNGSIKYPYLQNYLIG